MTYQIQWELDLPTDESIKESMLNYLKSYFDNIEENDLEVEEFKLYEFIKDVSEGIVKL